MSVASPTTLRTPKIQRCALYLRYSTKMQRKASLEDQERSCRQFAEQSDWIILDAHIYKDAATSGTKRAGRSGLAALQKSIEQKSPPFDYVLIDDTSRLGRNLTDVLTLTDVMKHYGVGVYFVSQRLDSQDENYRMMLTVHGMVDEQYVGRLRHKIKASHRGRILNGYHVGARPFGYRGVVIRNDDAPSAYGQAATQGTRLEIIEEEAAVVRRIFQMIADGYSMCRVFRLLNQESVPFKRRHPNDPVTAAWDEHKIKRIIHNEIYRGVTVRGKVRHVTHPVTGQVTKEKQPSDQHLRVETPHTRIVGDDVWNAVQVRLEALADKQKARLEGGFNRAKDKVYLYSGLLTCGLCESRMILNGKQGTAVYTCPKYRLRRGCTNHIRIREDRATAQLTEALASKLFTRETMDHLAPALRRELKKAMDRLEEEASEESVQSLETTIRRLERQIGNVLDAIERNSTQSLSLRLATLEQQKMQAEEKLGRLKIIKKWFPTAEELNALLEQNVHDFLQTLNANPVIARTFLARYIKKLTLYPSGQNEKPGFAVYGELDMFEGIIPPETRMLLEHPRTRESQQHTERHYAFIMDLDCALDVDCPIAEALCKIVVSEPQLSHDYRSPKEWASLVAKVVGRQYGPHNNCGYGALKRCFKFHRDLIHRQLDIHERLDEQTGATRYRLVMRERASELDCAA